MKRSTITAAAAGAVVASVLAGSVAWSAIPGPGGVIQGCYDSGGNVKVVEALPCPKGYTPLPWSQQGQQGIQGPKGDQGDQGPQGSAGLKGDTGDTGERGPAGPQGDLGPQGVQGPAGPQGAKGDKGDPGNVALEGRSCPGGSFVTGFDANGDLVCSAPGSGGGGGGDSGDLLVTPLQLTFPQQPVGTISFASFVTLTNTGTADLAPGITLTGANATDFSVGDCSAIPAQGTCDLSVAFAPTGIGQRTAQIVMQRPNGQTITVWLSGDGVSPSA